MSDRLCHLPCMNIRDDYENESELSGYLELGMVAEAEELASRYLTEPHPSVARFNEAMDAVLVSDKLSRWEDQVEHSYCRLTPDKRRKVRFKMLSFYWSLKDFGTAADFLSIRHCETAAELFFTMDVLLERNRMEEAKTIAQKCKRALKARHSHLDEGLLRDALARFYARTGNPFLALENWHEVPINSPLLHNRLVNVVELCLSPALIAVTQALKIVSEKRQNPDLSIEVQLPGIEQSLTDDIERDLLRLQSKLEKIIPPARQRELGIDAAIRRGE
jgi:hypothetical protein